MSWRQIPKGYPFQPKENETLKPLIPSSEPADQATKEVQSALQKVTGTAPAVPATLYGVVNMYSLQNALQKVSIVGA